MRIVYSYLPSETGPIKDMDKFLLYSKVSLFYSRKLSDDVVLYTDSETKKLVEDYGLEYDEINTDVMDSYDGDTFNYAIPKILTYINQTKPYIHLDFDTILFELPDTDNDVFFGYYDYQSVHDEGVSNYYLDDFGKISNKLLGNIMKGHAVKQIPNFSLFGVNKPNEVADTFKEILKFYIENKNIFDDMKHGPSQLEQFLFYPFYFSINREHDWYYSIEKHNTLMIWDGVIYLPNDDSFKYEESPKDGLDSYIELIIKNWEHTFIHLNDVKNCPIVEDSLFKFFESEMNYVSIKQKLI